MAASTTIDDLARELAIRNGTSVSDSRALIRELFELVGDELEAKGEVKLVGVGKFTVIRRSSEVWDPKRKAMIPRKNRTAVKFTPAKELKEKING